MLTGLRTALFLLLMWAAAAWAEKVEFRVALEDKDTLDHLGTGSAIAKNPGVMIELVALLQTRIPDLHISFSRKPWARCLAELEAGTVDGIISSSFLVERMKMGVYPMLNGKDDRRYRLDTKSYSLYKLDSAPLTWDGDSFSNLQQGLIALRGYAIVEDLKKMDVAVNEVNSPDYAFRMLLAGRADGFIDIGEFGDYTLKNKPEFRGIIKVMPPIKSKDYYLQISHQFNAKHAELVPEIWKALAEIRASEFNRLTSKYLKLRSEAE